MFTIKKLFLMLLFAAPLSLYQNCGQGVAFQQDTQSSKLDGQGVDIVDNQDLLDDGLISDDDLNNLEDDGLINQDGTEGNGNRNPNNDRVTDDGERDRDCPGCDERRELEEERRHAHCPGCDDQRPKKKNCKDKKKKYSQEGRNSRESERGDTSYVCVVEGPGRSNRVGYISESSIGAQNSTPETLCMSKKACLEIMPSEFIVKGAMKTGFCKNGKAGTIPVSDAQAAAMIAEL
jgi:hypothetical protein